MTPPRQPDPLDRAIAGVRFAGQMGVEMVALAAFIATVLVWAQILGRAL